MNKTLLTADELAERIKVSAAYINHALKNTVFLGGAHYIRPVGGRKVMYKPSNRQLSVIPLANGGICRG